MRPRVKICCISSIAEAQLAVQAGADALGLVGPMPSGPGVLPLSLIRQIAASVPPPVATFLLTSATTVYDIVQQHQQAPTDTLQLVDALEGEAYEVLRQQLPAVRIVQVIHVLDETSVTTAQRIAPQVDALLLDSGHPNLATKELGGTGRVHNWTLSRRIVEAVETPVFLAGGLKPTNAVAALQQVHPFGLDVCSGLRTHGQLDPQKLQAFFHAVAPSS